MTTKRVAAATILLGSLILAERVQIKQIEKVPGIIFNKIEDTMLVDETYNIYSTIALNEVFNTRRYDSIMKNISSLKPFDKQTQETISAIRSRLNALEEYRAKFFSLEMPSPGVEVLKRAERAIKTLNEIRSKNLEVSLDSELREVYVDNDWNQEAISLLEKINTMTQAFSKINETLPRTAIKFASQALHGNAVLAARIIANIEETNLNGWIWPITQAIEFITLKTNTHAPKGASKPNTIMLREWATISEVILNGHYIIIFSLPFTKKEVWSTYELLPVPAFTTKEHLNTIKIQPRRPFMAIKPGTKEHFFISQTEMEECTKISKLSICQAPARIITELDCESGLLQAPSYSYLHICNKTISKAQKIDIIETARPDLWIISAPETTKIATYCTNQYEELQVNGTQYLTVPSRCIASIHNITLEGGRQPKGPYFVMPTLDITSEQAEPHFWDNIGILTKTSIIVICLFNICAAIYMFISCTRRTTHVITDSHYYESVELVDIGISFTGPKPQYDVPPTSCKQRQLNDPGYRCPIPECSPNTPSQANDTPIVTPRNGDTDANRETPDQKN